ncbi:hypothetical protein Ancab_006131 [Ancistrocladus abbreviatus]
MEASSAYQLPQPFFCRASSESELSSSSSSLNYFSVAIRNVIAMPIKSMATKRNSFSIVKAAASSSSSSFGVGSSASEELLGERMRKKKRSVAGIDQDELVDPRQLADSDSCFCEFLGVHLHYKISEAESDTANLLQEQILCEPPAEMVKVGLPMILLHGFGASVFSWNRVMKPLAHITGSKVLAFDRPAFGLTSRVSYLDAAADNDKKSVNPYSMVFSVLATLYFIDFLASEKAILMGHSAGALTAVNAYFEAPERVAALILVAPAILAPLSARKVAESNQSEKEIEIQKNNPDSEIQPNLLIRLRQILSKLYQYIIGRLMLMFKGMVDMASFLYKKAISAILRSALAVMLVRMIIDKFGIAAIRNAWYDASQVTEHVLHGYTKPLKTKNWDRALIEYTAAMLTDSAPEPKPSMAKRFHQIACPGDTDRLVPAWNAERLSRAIPGSQFEAIKNCGHLPHEERPEEFIAIVGRFLQKAFTGSEELSLQASV